MKGLKITVITVAYNSASTISDTLRSVATQTHPNVEHILVDGASTDETMTIVATHGAHLAKVVSECDKGIYDAMNKGVRLATGEVVGFINSDDFYAQPEALAKVVRAFADDTVDAVYGDLCYVRQDATSEVVRYWRSCEFVPGLFNQGWCPPHPTLFVRRRVYERCGVFDLRYRIAADVELMTRLFELHRIRSVYLPEVLVHMRMGGTTNRNWANVMTQNREIWRALNDHGLKPSLFKFAAGKIVSRGRQLLSRPQ